MIHKVQLRLRIHMLITSLNNKFVIGIGHSVFQQSFYPYYLSFDDEYNLMINAGSDFISQPINFKRLMIKERLTLIPVVN